MSFLTEMGIQQWRLRGRRQVPASIKETLKADNDRSIGSNVILSQEESLPEERALTASANAPDQLKRVPKTKLLTETLHEQTHTDGQEVQNQSDTLGLANGDDDIITSSTANTDVNPLEASIAQANPGTALVSPQDSSTSYDDVEKTNVEKTRQNDVVMPSLRPAPVPFDKSTEIDLRISEPEKTPEVVSETPPLTEKNSVDEAPDVAGFNLKDQAPEDGGAYLPINDSSNTNVDADYSAYLQVSSHALEGDSDEFSDLVSVSVSESDSSPLETSLSSEEHRGLVTSPELSTLDWRALQARISNDKFCPSCGQAQSSLGFGDVLADWMFVTDAPTTPELESQQLFVGRAAQLYEGILRACGLTRERVYSSCVFKCSPPEDISLSPGCDKLIHRQIELIQPKVIVAFGEFASQAVLRANEPFDILIKGRHIHPATASLVIPSFSPQQLLTEPELKSRLWHELKLAMQEVG